MINTFLSSPKGEKFGSQTGVEKHEKPKHPLAGPQAQVKKFETVGNIAKKIPGRPGFQMVAREGIEPPTRGFSVLCSTN